MKNKLVIVLVLVCLIGSGILLSGVLKREPIEPDIIEPDEPIPIPDDPILEPANVVVTKVTMGPSVTSFTVRVEFNNTGDLASDPFTAVVWVKIFVTGKVVLKGNVTDEGYIIPGKTLRSGDIIYGNKTVSSLSGHTSDTVIIRMGYWLDDVLDYSPIAYAENPSEVKFFTLEWDVDLVYDQ